MQRHIVLIGFGAIGRRVLRLLQATETNIVVIDSHCDPNDPDLQQVTLVHGDCRNLTILQQANIANATGVLILTSDELVNLATMLRIHKLNSHAKIVIRIFHQEMVAKLGVPNHRWVALSTSALTAPVLALMAITGSAMGGFHLPDGTPMEVSEVVIKASSSLRGMPIGEITRYRKAEVIALKPRDGNFLFHYDIPANHLLQPGERIILCGEMAEVASLRSNPQDQEEESLIFPAFAVRYGRVFIRSIREMDLPLKIAACVLVAVISISTTVMYLAIEDIGIAGAFYRTISVMATMADMKTDGDVPWWAKLFVGLLRLSGAALVAAFTAIFTNYLLRANLGGAFEIRRIPDGGHIVVSGIGNVGFRVVEALLAEDERVVVIEKDAKNPFIANLRRRGAAVLIGDATFPEVMQEARANKAKAIIAATSNDLANLQTALFSREENQSQRLILRLADSYLADSLRESGELRLAVSIPELAAPAFVAALYEDHVKSVLYLSGVMFLTVEFIVQDDSVAVGLPVRALAIDYRLIPLHLQSAEGVSNPRPMNARLDAGDKLTVVVALSDLQRLLRKETPPRCWDVEVDAAPLPSIPYLVQVVRTHQGLGLDEAEKKVEEFPLTLAQSISRGEAEDILALLNRERIQARLVDRSNQAAVDVNS